MCVCPSRESCESHPPEFTPSLPYPVQVTLTPKLKSKLAVIPDLNGLRFCRVCNHFLPLAKFPSGVRRFVCRQHLWQQVGKQARDTLLAKPGQKMITRLWLRCYKDREAFRQPRIELKYDDIRELVSDSRISAEKFAIMPARPEPTHLISRRRRGSKHAPQLQAFRNGGAAEYAAVLGALADLT